MGRKANPDGRRNVPLEFGEDARTLVRVLAGWGMPIKMIATQVRNPVSGKQGISDATLYRHFEHELEVGRGALVAQAMVTQHTLLTRAKDHIRDRVSARILRQFGYLKDQRFVISPGTPEPEPDVIEAEARETDRVELEKAILQFMAASPSLSDQEPPEEDDTP